MTDRIEVLLLAPDASGECRLEVATFPAAVAAVAGGSLEEARVTDLVEVPGLRAMSGVAGEEYPGRFAVNPLASCVVLALGAPEERGALRGPVAFYRVGPAGGPVGLTIRDAVLLTSVTIRSVQELGSRVA